MENKTMAELREIGKELNVSNRWRMTKAQLICEIEKILSASDNVSKVEQEEEQREKYILDAPLGTLICFVDKTRKCGLNTAKMVNRNVSKKMVKAETQYGKEYLLNFNDIVWVRTNGGWPRGIYNTLKGIEQNA